MKVSEITNETVINYVRMPEDENPTPYLLAAKEFVKTYTGLDDTALDVHEDISIVVLILCSDMYDNRSVYVDKNNLNKVVDTILGMYSINML